MLTLITLVTTNKLPFAYKFLMYSQLKSLVLVSGAVSLQCERTAPGSVILNPVFVSAFVPTRSDREDWVHDTVRPKRN